MLKKIVLVILLSFTGIQLYSQSTSGWNVYTSLRETKGISLGNNLIWAATSGGLFNFDPNNTSVTKKYTSLDGLRSNELTALTYSTGGVVWTGAFDGSISVLNTGDASWRQITDINSSSEPSKRINAFYEYNNLMFFATEFCIVKFNIPQFQFVDQPYTRYGTLPANSPVYDIAVINDTLWAATKNGIAYANINNNLPIASNWSTFVTGNSVLKNNKINCISYFDSKVFMGSDSGLVYFQNGTLNTFAPLVNGNPFQDPVYRLAVSGNTLYFSAFSLDGSYRYNFRIYRVNSNNLNNAELIESGTEVNSLKVNAAGDLLIGTVNNGVEVSSAI